MVSFDATLVLRLSSGNKRAERNHYVKEGGYMSWLDDWADDESRRIKREQAERDEQRRLKEELSEQGSQLWSSVKHWVKKGLEKINSTPILRDKVGSEVSYADLSETSFEVSSIGYPRITLTLTRNGLYFKLNVKRIESGDAAAKRIPGETETLNLDLDEDENIFVRSPQGDALVREAVAEYLLHKLLI